MRLYYPCLDLEATGEKLPVMVVQGFSWRVLLFGWVGLLLHGTWLSALLAGSVTLLLGGLVHDGWHVVIIATLHVALSVFTPEIRLWEQRLGGRMIGMPVAAPDKAFALLRWLDRQRSTMPPKLPCASS